MSAEWHLGVDHGVLIVAKCNVNSALQADHDDIVTVLIVAKCNVNNQISTNLRIGDKVLIVAKCNVNS